MKELIGHIEQIKQRVNNGTITTVNGTEHMLVKQLESMVKLALTIPIVIPRYSVSLVYVKNITNGQETALRCFITNADSEEEALGKAVIYFTDEMRSFNLSNKVVLRANEG